MEAHDINSLTGIILLDYVKRYKGIDELEPDNGYLIVIKEATFIISYIHESVFLEDYKTYYE